MKRYADGGSMPEKTPEGIQDVLQQRKENKGLEKFESDRTAENKSAREPVRDIKEKLKSMFSSEKESKAVKKAKGGCVTKMAKGGKIDGCAIRGKTKGRMI
jgi:hypothetical protein